MTQRSDSRSIHSLGRPVPRPLRRGGATAPWAGAALCLVLLASPLAHAADDWTQEGQDAGSTSRNSDQAGLNAGNLTQMRKLWARDLDIWQQSTGLAVADEQVFVGRKIADTDTTVQQQLMRLDLATGDTVWKVDTPEGFGNPALTPELVITAGNAFGPHGLATPVQAFDRATGERRWKYLHPLPSVAFQAPHVLDGVVYLVSFDGDAVALDAASGALLWRRKHDANCCSTNGLAVADGVVLISRSRGMLALDAADGHTLWRYDLPPFELAPIRPMIVDGTALLYELSGRLDALDLATGTLRWSVMTPGGKTLNRASGTMATDGQRIFVLNGVVKPVLSAISLADGATLWSSQQHVWTHSPVVSNGVLYLADDKQLLARDPVTGAALPMARLPAMRWGALVVASGRVLSSGGPVRAVGLAAGN